MLVEDSSHEAAAYALAAPPGLDEDARELGNEAHVLDLREAYAAAGVLGNHKVLARDIERVHELLREPRSDGPLVALDAAPERHRLWNRSWRVACARRWLAGLLHVAHCDKDQQRSLLCTELTLTSSATNVTLIQT